MNDAVTIDADGHVRILTFNRPDSLNAFDDDLHRGLPAALREVENDREARVIVLTGAGRAFSAGGDIEDFDKLGNDLWLRRTTLRTGRQLFEDIVGVHLPIVAAVNGPAVGLGCTIATACDFVLVSDKAFLADPHVQVALVAGDGGAITWPLNAGLLRAKRYLLTGDRMSPEVAVELGLATEVVPADTLMDEAITLAKKVAALAPQAVQDTKSVLNQHLRMAAVTSLHYGLAAESQSHDTDEYRAVPETFRARKG
ncbi:enoyl-CoA hydratase/isomerase family protein [Gordonia polyisoprenivorans]|uniref:enoyl-CoA hydratase/isomerase family protein n=1 Tax=Gordonia polyisoprenivorans TaxID=84595 RepID=UPI001AD7D6DC|nr:enoyl-CoA hydratase/isomerase family protein [Gordonia polyisoprenivorans]QTI70939.1 enoyl-CoA hydratase/isomerase family protein [Gordonia polyisoprenivorans]